MPEVIPKDMTHEEREHIEELYIDMYDLLMSYAISSLEKESLAEEAVQEAFRIACMKPDALISSPNPRGWIINTLKFTIANQKRNRDAATRVLAAYMSSMEPELVISQDKVRLEILYENVAGSDEFQLLKEMAVDGRSHLEMAEKRGISVSACKKRVQRAKEYLKKKLF